MMETKLYDRLPGLKPKTPGQRLMRSLVGGAFFGGAAMLIFGRFPGIPLAVPLTGAFLFCTSIVIAMVARWYRKKRDPEFAAACEKLKAAPYADD